MIDIESSILTLVGKTLNRDANTLTLETTMKSLSMSSIRILGLCSVLEEEYNIQITMAEASKAKTIEDFAKLISSKLK
jgi:acyl carrier protein